MLLHDPRGGDGGYRDEVEGDEEDQVGQDHAHAHHRPHHRPVAVGPARPADTEEGDHGLVAARVHA